MIRVIVSSEQIMGRQPKAKPKSQTPPNTK
jgi:hypothetical protein